jgi:type IV pilus assembly protein PilW
MSIHRSGPRHRRSGGFGLIEIMVGLLIGSILIAGVVQLFIGSRRTYETNEAMARIQENGRFALMELTRDIRMAGYQGCGIISADSVQTNIIAEGSISEVQAFMTDNVIDGTNDIGTNTFQAQPGNDVITLRFASPDAAAVTDADVDNANLKIANNGPDIQQGETVVVSDCVNADVFNVTNVSNTSNGPEITLAHANNLNTTNRLSKVYDEGALLMRFVSRRYYVRDTGRTGIDGDPILALYRDDPADTSSAVPLIDGVESLQILYGEDTNADYEVDRFATADAVDMDDVIAVRIALLIGSTGPAKDVAEAGTYQVGDVTVGPDEEIDLEPDRRLRMVFTATTSLRNRELLSDEL